MQRQRPRGARFLGAGRGHDKLIRMTRRLPIAVLVFSLHAVLSAEVLYIKAGRLIVDATKPAIPQGALVVTDGIITAAGANVARPAGARQIDLGAYTVLPSILDAHCHLWSGPFLQTPTPGYAALKAAQAVGYAVQSGVSAMRVLGSADFVDVAMREAIEDGTIPGPHIIPAAHALTIPEGMETASPCLTVFRSAIYTRRCMASSARRRMPSVPSSCR